MPDIAVRSALPTDVDAVAACQEACWREAYGGLVAERWLDDPDLPARRRERWRRRIDGERSVVVAVAGHEVVGVGSAGARKDEDVDPEIELTSLYVRRAHWRAGVGSRLLTSLVGDADAYLWVFEENRRARDFYAAHGFRPDGAGKLDPGTDLWELRLVRRSADGPARMAAAGLVDYRSDIDDNTRWADFAVRDGDVVISTRSKSGTTWMQQICAVLVHQASELPEPLARLSPWLDHLVEPQDAMFARLAGQRGRRIVKTHTPLDGVRVVDSATYIVVARQPIDLAVSLYHQGGNLDRERIAELAGLPPPPPGPDRLPLHEWLLEWVDRDVEPPWLDSIHGVLSHVADARSRAAAGGRVLVVRYEDLLVDLDGWMRVIAARLGVAVDPAVWPALVSATTFASMRADVAAVAPDPGGILRDPTAFFRRGTSGAGRETLSEVEYRHYRDRVRELSSPILDAWLHAEGRQAPTSKGRQLGDAVR
jgi:aryl sulfotransferase